MEYEALVQNCAMSECGSVVPEEDLIEELLVEGCWVETSGVGSEGQYLGMGMGMGMGTAQESEVGKRWWIGPRANPGPSSSVKDRLALAVAYLKEYTKDANALIQIWVPLRRAGLGLDYHTNPDDTVSVAFPINPNSNPNPNINLRFFRCHEYPRLPYDVPGSLSLPVFEKGTAACLGVVQIVMTNQTTIHYHPQFDQNNVCNAFEGVDLRSCENFIPAGVKVFEELYEAAVNEMVEVLTSACKTHNLPLALTWAPCIQQGKCGYGHSTENYVSTVESACFVGDVNILGFQEACSECHLLRGQGIVGTAFTTGKPCFAIDITAFSKAEYPLAPHAKIVGLNAAVAIPLRSLYTGSADFVLEFFLPKGCHDSQEQKHILSSLSMLLQQACRSLHVVMEDEFALPQAPAQHVETCGKESSWIAHMMEAQQKGKGVCVSLEYPVEETKEEFKVTTNWDRERERCVGEGSGEECQTFVGRRSSSSGGGGRKGGEKRRTKAEKTISLPVLRQYFAGSLKDAAKSIGVCPTTLKRICRQHGITRWPSRKIKKVGHSLKKLQLVIDSVQGAEGAIQIGSFYSSFPELSSATAQSSKSNKMPHPHRSDNNNNNFLYDTALKSPPSSSASTIINAATDVLITESPTLRTELPELHPSIQFQHEDTKHLTTWNSRPLRVKATFADEKIRFSLQPIWGLNDLQLEIGRRFNLKDVSNMVLKYLDDEGEWVVLACNADLEECKDLHKSSQSRTIRLALFQASPLNLPNTFANTSPS